MSKVSKVRRLPISTPPTSVPAELPRRDAAGSKSKTGPNLCALWDCALRRLKIPGVDHGQAGPVHSLAREFLFCELSPSAWPALLPRSLSTSVVSRLCRRQTTARSPPLPLFSEVYGPVASSAKFQPPLQVPTRSIL
eukprot:3270943-Prymnesium_polylepis.2